MLLVIVRLDDAVATYTVEAECVTTSKDTMHMHRGLLLPLLLLLLMMMTTIFRMLVQAECSRLGAA
jgi:hypothetical protein